MTDSDIRRCASSILWMFFDVDGVLTDGSLFYGDSGETIKRFNALDGQGIKMLQARGVGVGILSGRSHAAVERRAHELGIAAVFQDVADKLGVLRNWAGSKGLALNLIGHMGDDLPDVPVIEAVGFGASVVNGHPSALRSAIWVSQRRGGEGAVREACDFILGAKE